MPPKKLMTKAEFIQVLINATSTLTQEQIDACMYVMSSCRWTRETMTQELMDAKHFWETHLSL